MKGGRSKSRMASAGKTGATKARCAASGGKKKGRVNCYSAFLKAKLADKKLTKV